MLPLIGILIVVAGFALRLNALLVVTVAGVATGMASGKPLVDVVAAFGHAFLESRYVALVWLVVHGTRLLWLDRGVRREGAPAAPPPEAR